MYFIFIAAVVFLDQWTKHLVKASIALNDTVPLLKDIFHFTHIHNYGAAFSLLEDQRIFLILLPAIITTGILFYLARWRKKTHWMMLLSLSLIAAGGIGNLIDRIGRGYVVDFLDFRFFPVFNVADISVCFGCGMLVLYLFLVEPKLTRK